MAIRILSARAESRRPSRKTEYLERLPAIIPSGKALVHNDVRPTRRLGANGFRAFLVDEGDARWLARREVCDCGWAPELGMHHRVAWQTEAH